MPVLLQTMINSGLGADVGSRDVRGLLFLHVMTSITVMAHNALSPSDIHYKTESGNRNY